MQRKQTLPNRKWPCSRLHGSGVAGLGTVPTPEPRPSCKCRANSISCPGRLSPGTGCCPGLLEAAARLPCLSAGNLLQLHQGGWGGSKGMQGISTAEPRPVCRSCADPRACNARPGPFHQVPHLEMPSLSATPGTGIALPWVLTLLAAFANSCFQQKWLQAAR